MSVIGSKMDVSPGFTPRPSLSDPLPMSEEKVSPGVAGVHTSAFVERQWPASPHPSRINRVAGVHTSAFVERDDLIALAKPAGGVAGVHTSAFVERVRLL